MENVKELKALLADTISKHVKKLPLIGSKLVPDPVPVAPPVGYERPPSMIDTVRNMIRSEQLRREVEAAGFETFQEADDFDVGDDYDPSSPYEETFDPVAERVESDLRLEAFESKVSELRKRFFPELEIENGRSEGVGERSVDLHEKRPAPTPRGNRGPSAVDKDDQGSDN